MESLYKCLEISRQAFHQHRNKQKRLSIKSEELLSEVRMLRAQNPRLSSRKIYGILRPNQFGRDRFQQFCFSNGLKLYRKRSYHRTTDSRGVTRFDNLLSGLELTKVNQAWVSDITYYRIGERHYYITLIMDRFSRAIVGHSVSSTLHADVTTLLALRQAIESRKPGKGLIFHSDGGGQYYCNEFKELTKQGKFLNSMGKSAYENPHAERLNGTIKNDYLVYYRPTNFMELREMLSKAVYNYNNNRPHSSLKELTPMQFERNVIHNSTPITKEKKKQKKKNYYNNNK